MTHEQIIHALSHIRPGAVWSLSGERLEWLDKVQTQPTQEELEAACHSCDPIKEAFLNMTTDEKISFLAKRLGLED